MPVLPLVNVNDADAMAQVLRERGACCIEGLPAPMATVELRDDLRRLQAEAALAPAAVGRGAHVLRTDLRGDSTLWLDDPRCGAAARQYLAMLDGLRVALNPRLFLGLAEVEAHYAVYPSGAGYMRHRDRFRDDARLPSSRMLSLVSYLNDDWREAEGGALRLHLDDGAIDVLPLGGSSVCFLSELEHEVLPATRERLSIAAWFRRAR
ncbi:MAG TPA: 2OG-Fe(II) oxygenase [Luteimonas sp.]|nr:2OG-Fe(II) oxygenase [Luteimonas sp.]